MERSSTSIAENVRRLEGEIAEAAVRAGRNPAEVRLMAVTKTRPAELVNEVIAAGVTLLGENRAQELAARFGDYRKGAEIHFIGHLQTNKVKQIADKVDVIESVASLRLAAEISRQCEALGKEMGLLIEVNIGGEESKSGVPPEQAEALIREIAALPAVKVKGLMAIPPIFSQSPESELFFARMQQMQVDIAAKNIDNVSMEILSMGMSDDFAAAIKHGSTQVRIGTALFGRRTNG